MKISFSSKYFRISLDACQGIVSIWIVIAWSPKYLETEGLRYFSKISMYFCVSALSEVGTRAPLEVTQPQNITEIRLFSSWHTQSGLYFASDFFQISNYWSFPIITMVSSAKKGFHGSGVKFILSLQNFIHFCLFAALMTFYIFRILLLSPNWLMCLLTVV